MNSLDMTILQIFLLLVFMHLFFLFAVIKKRNDIADTAWGLGFIVLALTSLFYNLNTKTLLVSALVAIWGIRLVLNNYRKFKASDTEDKRYLKWRKNWGERQILWSWLKVFLLQTFFLILVAMPILIIARYSKGGWNPVNSLGVLVWLFGFVYEVIADRQLRLFFKNKKKDSKSKIMQEGLWKYSRHPNYFGEAVLWLGILLVAWGEQFFLLSFVGFFTIFLLLRFVSGVPMSEERYSTNKEFLEYKKKTPPMFPKFF